MIQNHFFSQLRGLTPAREEMKKMEGGGAEADVASSEDEVYESVDQENDKEDDMPLD